MNIQEELQSNPESQYGQYYKEHILDIYKIYVEMADRVSSRRQSANSFFLSINTAVVAFMSYAQFGKMLSGEVSKYIWILGIIAMALSYVWYRLIRSYKDLNSGKFKVIHEIEKLLPISPYDTEWTVLGRGKNRKLYLQFTKIEMLIPWIFFLLNTVFVLLLARNLLIK